MTIDPRISDTQHMIGEWARKTFPQQTARTIADHLQEEAKELHVAVHSAQTDYEVSEQLADVLILAFALADFGNISLAEAINWKHAINRRRAWVYSDQHGYDKKADLEYETYDTAFVCREHCAPGRDHGWSERTVASDEQGWIAGMVYQSCDGCGSRRFVDDTCHENGGHVYGLMVYDTQRDMYCRVCQTCNATLFLDAEDVKDQTVEQATSELPDELVHVQPDGTHKRYALRYEGRYDALTGQPIEEDGGESQHTTENAPRTQENAPLSDETAVNVQNPDYVTKADLEAFLASFGSALTPLLRGTADAIDHATETRASVVPRGTVSQTSRMVQCSECGHPNLTLPLHASDDLWCSGCGYSLKAVL